MKWNKEKSFLSQKELEAQDYMIAGNYYPPVAYKGSFSKSTEKFYILTCKEWQALQFLEMLQKDVDQQILETPTSPQREGLTLLNISILTTIDKIKGE